jgi:hypothetical protein
MVIDPLSRGRWQLVAVGLVGVLLLAAVADRRAQRANPGPEDSRAAGPDQEAQTQLRAIDDRRARKGRIVAALIAGRLTLLEAAGRFRALDRGPPPFHWEEFHAHYQGDSDEERHCHEVLAWVEIELADTDPCLLVATHARLLDELETHLIRGRLRLPEPPRGWPIPGER